MPSTPSLISLTMFGARDKWLKETFYLLFLSKYLISHHTRQPIDVKFSERTGSGIVWVYARLLIKHSNIMCCIKDAWCHQLTAVVSHAPWPIVISSDRDSFVYKVTTRHINKKYNIIPVNGLGKHSSRSNSVFFFSITIIIFLDPVRYVTIIVQDLKSLVILKKSSLKSL